MKKVDSAFIIQSYSSDTAISSYEKAVYDVGLWESERKLFNKYFETNGYILDIGCGAGRTTFGLYREGFTHIQGIDIAERMVEKANALAKEQSIPLCFKVGDINNLRFPDSFFDFALFSFNGMMQIPGKNGRNKALAEVRRVLKDGGIFIFTTHNREEDAFKNFWQEEEREWRNGEQDQRLFEFGDLIVELEERETYLHIPTKKEVESSLSEAGLSIVESTLRSAVCDERTAVLENTSDCIFWVVKK